MLILVRSKLHPCTVWELAYNTGKFCVLRGYPPSLPSPFSPATLSTTARGRVAWRGVARRCAARRVVAYRRYFSKWRFFHSELFVRVSVVRRRRYAPERSAIKPKPPNILPLTSVGPLTEGFSRIHSRVSEFRPNLEFWTTYVRLDGSLTEGTHSLTHKNTCASEGEERVGTREATVVL